MDQLAVIEALRSYRSSHPEPITLHAAGAEVREATGARMGRTQLRELLLTHGTDLHGWITDLDDRPVPADTSALLEQWLAAGQTERSSITQRLEDSLRTQPDHPIRAIAAALGALPPESGWEAAPISSVPAPFLPALIEAAASTPEGVSWLLRAACRGDALVGRAAREAWGKLPDAPRRSAVEVALASWPVPGDEGDRARATARALSRLVPADHRPHYTEVATTALASLDASAGAAWWELLADFALQGSTPPDWPGSRWRQLLVTLADDRDVNASVRLRALTAAAATVPEALGVADIWRGIEVDGIGQIVSHPEVGATAREAGRDPLTRLVGAWTKRSGLGEILGTVQRRPGLANFVDPAALAEKLRSNETVSRLAAAAVEVITAEASAALERAEAAMQEQISETRKANEAVVALEHRVAETQRRADDLEERLRSSSTSAMSAHDSELRQARVDVLRDFVEIVERLRAAARAVTPATPLEHLLEDAERALARFGVEVVGRSGDRRSFDPVLDRPDVSTARMVEVLAPAYVFVGDSATPLRHAVVRSID